MSWIQIRIDTTSDHAEHLEYLLLETNASAVTLQDAKDQPLYEPKLGSTPLWSNTTVIGLFDAHHDIPSALAFLKEHSNITPFPLHKIEIVEDKDWEREWMTHFHPIKFGARLWVCPSWRDPPETDAVNLMLDPGLAFGTGTHQTTALCLQWLDQQHDLIGKSIIDYGCGSGILAIAALMLGADNAIGVDLDHQALEATLKNARNNQIPHEKLQAFLPENQPETTADLVVANILAGPLVQLAPKLASQTKHGGRIALSGILSEQVSDIISTYQRWFIMDKPITRDDWAMVSGKRHGG